MNKVNIDTKRTNYNTILTIIKDHGPISRMGILEYSKLSWGTVSATTSELYRLGLVQTYKDEHNQLGRNPDMFVVNDKDNLCLGIDINILGLVFLVCDISNKILTRRFVSLKSNIKDDILNQLEDNTKELIEEYKNIITINISMQGQIDTNKGISITAEHFKGWNNVEIKKFFEDKFNIRTFLYHDPDCLATYHYSLNHNNLKSYSNSAIIKLDEGIGMSLIIDNKLYSTINGFSPEIGHNIVNPNGVMCNCGKRGCLEAYCSLLGLTARYNDSYNKTIDIPMFQKLLDSGDKDAIKILIDNMKYLGYALANLVNSIRPDIIIIDGMLSKYSHLFINIVDETIKNTTDVNVLLGVANYNNEAAALGANVITIDNNLTSIIFRDENENNKG